MILYTRTCVLSIGFYEIVGVFWKEFTMSFAQRLKNARENAHILQKELSERSGVALRTIQNWETGVRRPSNIESVTKVAKVLGVSTSELIDSEEEFVISANEKYGPRGKKGAETVLTEVRSLFAGGEMSEEDMDTFMQAIQDAYWKVKAENREKYTTKKNKQRHSQWDRYDIIQGDFHDTNNGRSPDSQPYHAEIWWAWPGEACPLRRYYDPAAKKMQMNTDKASI